MRLYTLNITPTVTAPYNAAWNVTAGGTLNGSYLLNPSFRLRNNVGNVVSPVSGAVAPVKMFACQLVTPPMLAQVLNCTLTGQVRHNHAVTASVVNGLAYVRLINSDGTVASELGSMTTANVSTTLTNVTYSTLTLTGVSVTAGQRIAIELGGNFTSGANVATTAAVNIADNSVTDLPVDNTTTTANNCWFEFSQAIKFYPMTGMM